MDQSSASGGLKLKLTFKGAGLPEASADGSLFEVRTLTIREAISTPYRIVLDVLSDDGDIDLKSFVDTHATLEIVKQHHAAVTTQRTFTGLVTGVSFVAPLPALNRFHYAFVIEPDIVMLARSRQSQIYGSDDEVSVIDIVTREITGQNTVGDTPDASVHLPSARLDTRAVTATYPSRDYIVQYRESDFDFCSRLLEHWGVFYFFAPSDAGEVMVLGDSNGAFPKIEAQELSFVQGGAAYLGGADSVRSFRAVQTPLPKKVILRDYNDEMPHVSLEAESEVDPDGHGVVSLFAEHFLTPSEGETLAGIRAEEIACRGLVYEGQSDCPQLAAGYIFKLVDHPRASCNGEYLVIEVEHTTARERVLDVLDDNLVAGTVPYRNTFKAIPVGTAFRPARVTPRPQVAGQLPARIDAAGDGIQSELDDQGRYTVRMGFDASGRADGKGSRQVRMAQPYAGPSSGMHFPLLKGTDVAVTHYNGDPDRPLIAGAVPNPLRKSPVNSANGTANRIETTSGVVVEMGDGALEALSDGGGSQTHAAAPPSGPASSRRDRERRAATQAGGRTQRHLLDNGTDDVSASSDQYFYVSVLNSSGTEGYQRIGADQGEDDEDAIETVDVSSDDGSYTVATNGDAWFDYAKGTRLSVTTGDRTEVIGGKWSQYIVGDDVTKTDGSKKEVIKGLSESVIEGNTMKTHYGAEIKHILGYKHSTVMGLSTSITGALVLKVALSGEFSAQFPIKASAVGTSFSCGILKSSNYLTSTDVYGIVNKTVGSQTEQVASKIGVVGYKQEAVGVEIKSTAIKKEAKLAEDSVASLLQQYNLVTKDDSVTCIKTFAAEFKSGAVEAMNAMLVAT